MKKETIKEMIRRIVKEESQSPAQMMTLAKQWVSLATAQKQSQKTTNQADAIGKQLFDVGILSKNDDKSHPLDLTYHYWDSSKCSSKFKKIADWIGDQVQ